MAHSYALPRGLRVCLRLIRLRDLRGLERLFARQGLAPDELELARLVRADRGADRQPWLLLADEQITEGLEPLLSDALLGRARALARPRAA